MRSFARSDVGRRREQNEDSYFRDDELGLYVVADGMGGHAAGEIASAEAVDTVFGMIKRGLPDLGECGPRLTEAQIAGARRLLEGAIQAATYMVYAISEVDRGKAGMGTTMSAALVVGAVVITGQVGDSRIYRIRGRDAQQLTEDHTLVAWQIKQGVLTEEEAKVSPHRNVITRSVGGREYVEVDTSVLEVTRGDHYLLCSDGLYGYLEKDEIPDVVALGGEAAIDAFIKIANDRGGRDNITAILVSVE